MLKLTPKIIAKDEKDKQYLSAISILRLLEKMCLEYALHRPLNRGALDCVRDNLSALICLHPQIFYDDLIDGNELIMHYQGICKIIAWPIVDDSGNACEIIKEKEDSLRIAVIAFFANVALQKILPFHPNKRHINDFIRTFLISLHKSSNNLDPSKFIDREILKIMCFLESDNVDSAHQDIFKFRMLQQNLNYILKFSPQLARNLTSRLASCNEAGYHGISMEVNVAQKLCRHRIDFINPDPPDFQIGDVKIECTSCHVVDTFKKKDILYKFSAAINNKKASCKTFVDRSTAVFIEATNLSFHIPGLMSKNHTMTVGELQSILYPTDFGGMIIFNSVWDIENDQYKTVYNRIDHPNISTALIKLLDIVWPKGSIEMGHCLVPKIA